MLGSKPVCRGKSKQDVNKETPSRGHAFQMCGTKRKRMEVDRERVEVLFGFLMININMLNEEKS